MGTFRPARRTARSAAIFIITLGAVAATAWGASATGIDVSRWQHSTTLNWTAVKKDGIKFAFIKATEGRGYTNPYFRSDWNATGKLGIYHGAYHFARPSRGSAGPQARYFVRKAGLSHGRGVIAPVLDLEATGGLGVRALRSWTATWLRTVHQLTGRNPIIYVSPYFWRSHLGNSAAFHQYPLWVANYGVSHPDVPGGWPRWTFWQKTSSGRVRGIGGNVDINVFNGSARQLARMAHAATRSTPTGGGRPKGATSPPDPRPTRTTLHADESALLEDHTVTFDGTLVSASGTALAGRSVDLYRKVSGSTTWARLASATTGSTGGYTFTTTVDTLASYKVVYGGGKRFATSASPAVSVSLTPRTQTRIDLHSTATRIRPGWTVRLYGRLTDAGSTPLPGRRVHVYRKPVGGTTWSQVARPTTLEQGGGGWWLATVHPRRSFVYKTVWQGGTLYAPSTSNRQRVVVRH